MREARDLNGPASASSTAIRHQGSSEPMWIKRPLGPSEPMRANCTLVFAPSTISIGAWSVPISVFTQPGCAELTLILVSFNSAARCTVKAFECGLGGVVGERFNARDWAVGVSMQGQ